VSGLQGGHSGIDIQRPIGNANEILARALRTLARQTEVRLIDVRGGSAHNAIPRDARAVFWAAESTLSAVDSRVSLVTQQIRGELDDADLRMTATRAGEPSSAPVTAEDSVTALDLLIALPHGVDRMSAQIDGLVETSSNLATVRTTSESITVLTSQRSSVSSRLEAISTRIGSVAALAGARVEHTEGYPAWEPRLDSPLLARAKRTYTELFNCEPQVDVIHAGLECGVIGSIYPDMDMISIGPTIVGAHSPDERLELASLQRVWDFLVRLLETLGE
jgi:dipeptidase D